MTWQTCFKVFKEMLVEDKRHLFSIVSPPIRLEYEVGKETRADLGLIFCFDSNHRAVDFVRTTTRDNRWTVWIIRAQVTKGPQRIPPPFRGKILSFWQGKVSGSMRVPGGTVFAKSIIPMNRIWTR